MSDTSDSEANDVRYNIFSYEHGSSDDDSDDDGYPIKFLDMPFCRHPLLNVTPQSIRHGLRYSQRIEQLTLPKLEFEVRHLPNIRLIQEMLRKNVKGSVLLFKHVHVRLCDLKTFIDAEIVYNFLTIIRLDEDLYQRRIQQQQQQKCKLIDHTTNTPISTMEEAVAKDDENETYLYNFEGDTEYTIITNYTVSRFLKYATTIHFIRDPNTANYFSGCCRFDSTIKMWNSLVYIKMGTHSFISMTVQVGCASSFGLFLNYYIICKNLYPTVYNRMSVMCNNLNAFNFVRLLQEAPMVIFDLISVGDIRFAYDPDKSYLTICQAGGSGMHLDFVSSANQDLIQELIRIVVPQVEPLIELTCNNVSVMEFKSIIETLEAWSIRKIITMRLYIHDLISTVIPASDSNTIEKYLLGTDVDLTEPLPQPQLKEKTPLGILCLVKSFVSTITTSIFASNLKTLMMFQNIKSPITSDVLKGLHENMHVFNDLRVIVNDKSTKHICRTLNRIIEKQQQQQQQRGGDDDGSGGLNHITFNVNLLKDFLWPFTYNESKKNQRCSETTAKHDEIAHYNIWDYFSTNRYVPENFDHLL